MTALLIVLASIAAYLYIGWRIARWDLAGLWERGRYDGYGVKTDRRAKRDVLFTVHWVTLGWPVCWWWLWLGRHIERYDPKWLQAQLEQREREIEERDAIIARLERSELGVQDVRDEQEAKELTTAARRLAGQCGLTTEYVLRTFRRELERAIKGRR